ncbi:nitrate reductase maturation protein NarM [Aquirufa ecclesiirivi]|uniref:Nitrate reductase maturation protein NarM n=1 Tax=Aquirufa ecclesiirivi TaxID=2715124 RepID=A0ABT4JHZ2_9BACT|nr:nitrate reductase associated protein [Aquirufa ecclesiirivi]MCZ2475878.1 nitrate reductase maturation protein NarM [Aquirufa ecclesiirivi]
MKEFLNKPSIFKGQKGLEYFNFEEDFVEADMRCIPMVVRFKLDQVKIKLKLHEWAKFSAAEKLALALAPTESLSDKMSYKDKLRSLVFQYTKEELSELDPSRLIFDWMDVLVVPARLQEKAKEFAWKVSVQQWAQLSHLQRYALLKLTNPGHENKNFPIAMREFNIV